MEGPAPWAGSRRPGRIQRLRAGCWSDTHLPFGGRGILDPGRSCRGRDSSYGHPCHACAGPAICFSGSLCTAQRSARRGGAGHGRSAGGGHGRGRPTVPDGPPRSAAHADPAGRVPSERLRRRSWRAALPGDRSGGTIYATDIARGQVYALPDANGDGVADEVRVWADGLRQPHGLAFYGGYLYVGETNRVVRFPVGPDGTRQATAEPVVPDLPTGGHATRTVGFGPDGRLFLSVGSSCNVCEESDARRAAISVYSADGSAGRLLMRGLRNAVGFVWRPSTDEMWATNNGRDLLGDDIPFETVYRVRDGGDAGWPRCYPAPGGLRPDPQFGRPEGCQAVDPPAVTFQAHTAPLGLRFYDGANFPEAIRGDLFVALHGSWNRSTPVGYKVIRIAFAGGTPGQPEDFATGWMADEGNRSSVWGRPVDMLVAPDGALLVSDDDGGAIFRITYVAAE